MKITLCAFLLISLFPLVSVASEEDVLLKYKDRYQKLENIVESPEANIVEYFSYGCSHCFAADSYVKTFLKSNANKMSFSRYQVNMGYEDWARCQDVFAISMLLGINEKVHDDIFSAIHESKKDFTSNKDVIDFFSKRGFKNESKDLFTKKNKDLVDYKKKIDDEVAYLKLTGVPRFIVNGKYVVKWGSDMTHEEFTELLNAVSKLN